jgi:hypothetical protein
MKMKLILIFSLVSTIASSQNSDFENNIRKMLEIQGIERNWETAINQMIKMQKESNPDIDLEFLNRFQKKVLEDSYSKLFDLVVPIYKKYLTENEVKSIIEFYESEAGKSLITKTPMIFQESMTAGRKLGEEIASQIIEEIEKEKKANYEVINAGCETFKEGRFKYQMPDSTFMIIERDEKFQYEYYKGTTTKYKIKWLNECRYSLTMIKTDSEIMEGAKGQILITNIYETGIDYYKFVSTIEEQNYKLDGIVYKTD